EKRGDREVERLFKILEYSTELEQNQIDRAEQLGDCHLPSLKANADVALTIDKCRKVDATFNEKEEELKKFYVDLEKKLHINP
ncbi:Protein of unknown function, partial [Cotesia congregata]